MPARSGPAVNCSISIRSDCQLGRLRGSAIKSKTCSAGWASSTAIAECLDKPGALGSEMFAIVEHQQALFCVEIVEQLLQQQALWLFGNIGSFGDSSRDQRWIRQPA